MNSIILSQPDLKPGSWQACEYWTPMVCYTMWLMSELSTQPNRVLTWQALPLITKEHVDTIKEISMHPLLAGEGK